MTGRALLMTVVISSGCNIPSAEQSCRFRCSSDEHCLDGFRCLGGYCIEVESVGLSAIVPGRPSYVIEAFAADDRAVYWCAGEQMATTRTIWRLGHCETTPVEITTLQSTVGVMGSDGSSLYWSVVGDDLLRRMYISTDPFDDTETIHTITGASATPNFLVMTDRAIFGASAASPQIWRLYTGDGPIAVGSFGATGVAVTGMARCGDNHLCAIDANGVGIYKLHVDSSTTDNIFTNFDSNVIAVAYPGSEQIVWVNGITLRRGNLEGAPPASNVFSPVNASELAAYSGFVYWLDEGTGDVMRLELDSDNDPETIAPRQGSPKGLLVDNFWVYWINTETNSIMRAPR
jgi:hypothetical protein